MLLLEDLQFSSSRLWQLDRWWCGWHCGWGNVRIKGRTVPILQIEVYPGFFSLEGGHWSRMWNGSPGTHSFPGGLSFGFSAPTCSRHLVGMTAGLSWANLSKRGQFSLTADQNTRLYQGTYRALFKRNKTLAQNSLNRNFGCGNLYPRHGSFRCNQITYVKGEGPGRRGRWFLDSKYEFYIVMPMYLFEHVLDTYGLKYMKIIQVEGHVINFPF